MKQYPRCLKQSSLGFFLHISGCSAVLCTSFKTNNGTRLARKETWRSCTRYYGILYNGCRPFITNLRHILSICIVILSAIGDTARKTEGVPEPRARSKGRTRAYCRGQLRHAIIPSLGFPR
jgi:hypothetical protein